MNFQDSRQYKGALLSHLSQFSLLGRRAAQGRKTSGRGARNGGRARWAKVAPAVYAWGAWGVRAAGAGGCQRRTRVGWGASVRARTQRRADCQRVARTNGSGGNAGASGVGVAQAPLEPHAMALGGGGSGWCASTGAQVAPTLRTRGGWNKCATGAGDARVARLTV